VGLGAGARFSPDSRKRRLASEIFLDKLEGLKYSAIYEENKSNFFTRITG
jgi:hypothetical protein